MKKCNDGRPGLDKENFNVPYQCKLYFGDQGTLKLFQRMQDRMPINFIIFY
jgi:hypothetical protein